MRRIHQRDCTAALLTAWLVAQPAAEAADFRAGNLVVSRPWSSPTPPVATVGAVYFSISNTGSKTDRLTALSSPAARRVEIHENRRAQGMMRMRALDFVDCPPGSTVKIEPGGMHIMLVGLTAPLTPGMEFPLSLTFRDSGILKIMVTVSVRE
ncbi:MAG: copper chaperone PCu(A)C [Gammaproteobacteria bacterium]